MAKRKKLRKSMSRGRKVRSKNPNTTFIMFCEGDTEVRYFNSLNKALQDSNIVINTQKSNKTDCVGIQKYAETYNNTVNNEYDHYFLVFDKDSNNFDDIEKIMSNEKYKVLYSNPCFELWVLLHYKIIFNEVDCDEVLKKLKDVFPYYEKGQIFLFEALKDKLNIAIKNNKKLLKNFSSFDNKSNLSKLNPYTNFYQFFELIDKEKR